MIIVIIKPEKLVKISLKLRKFSKKNSKNLPPAQGVLDPDDRGIFPNFR